MPSGRLKESISSLPKDWQKQVLDLYEIGGSDVEIKAMIYKWRGSFSNDLWDRWMVDEPIFSETIKAGRAMSHAWWMIQGRSNLKVPIFSPTLWYMNMKNRFGWVDRIDQTSKGEPISQNIMINLGSGKMPSANPAETQIEPKSNPKKPIRKRKKQARKTRKQSKK